MFAASSAHTSERRRPRPTDSLTQRKETAPKSGDGTERLMTLWKTLAFPRAGMGAVRVSGGWMSPWTLFPQI